MLRVCQSCGAVFDGGCAAMKCPKCVAAERSSTLRPRVCRACGRTFDGGPRAWYCPECRAIRRREQGRASQARVAAGTTRKLGSTGVCEICGREYIVASGLQRYCPGCASDAVREIDRAQARAWAQANTTPEGRRKARSAAAAMHKCVVCGKLFSHDPARGKATTCSKECSAALHDARSREWEAANREYRSKYRRERRAEKKRKEDDIND